MLLDIDHFKQVNDRHGHLLGDRALRAVADAVTASIRKGDVAVRYGGEEILVVLPDTDSPARPKSPSASASAVAATACRSDLTVSVGIAAGDPHARHGPKQVFERADQALYRAKAGGRDRVVVDDTPRLHGLTALSDRARDRRASPSSVPLVRRARRARDGAS